MSNEVQLDGTAVSMLRSLYGCKLKERQRNAEITRIVVGMEEAASLVTKVD